MKANISRWFILLLALVCVAQAASAFDVKTETVNPASGALEPGQQVTARYVLTYDMLTDGGNDESFEFSTGLQNLSGTSSSTATGSPSTPPRRPGTTRF